MSLSPCWAASAIGHPPQCEKLSGRRDAINLTEHGSTSLVGQRHRRPAEAAPANERGPRSRTTAKLKSRQIILEKRNSCYKFYSDSGGAPPADGERGLHWGHGSGSKRGEYNLR